MKYILVVDDSNTSGGLLSNTPSKNAGYQSKTAEDGVQALKNCKKLPMLSDECMLVITDINTPKWMELP